jgi:RHS repeat-associated protein
VVLNDNNAIVGAMSFGTFGERRAAKNWSPWSAAQFSNKLSELRAISIRGFTGHEHVDHANIIHMNGRIYDSYTGRFMQAYPMVQAPENCQNLNRYSYVLNNPLSYTDPSGYFFSNQWDNIKPFVGVIVGVALGAFCGGCTAPMIGA